MKFELDDSKKESIAFHALQFAKKAPNAAMRNEVDEQSATDSGQFLRELSEISPQSVANPSICDGIFVCSNVLEDHERVEFSENARVCVTGEHVYGRGSSASNAFTRE